MSDLAHKKNLKLPSTLVLPSHGIEVEVTPAYVGEQSEPWNNRYLFIYNVRIRNEGDIGSRLTGRHWIVYDADGNIEEVKGTGVVGEQPFLSPGDSYTYTSGTVLATPVGCMHGSYQFVTESGEEFEAEIPAFSLAAPHTLH